MKIFADYHTHTLYSHGKGSIEENVVSGIKKGLEEIAITDHGPSNIGIGVKLKDFSRMKKEIKYVQRKYDNIKIKLGVEANVIGMDGKLDVPLEILKTLDIVLVGFHPIVIPASFKDGVKLFLKNQISKHLKILTESSKETNTRALINALEKYPVDIITHPGYRVAIDTHKLAKAAARNNAALEINCSHHEITGDYIKIGLAEGVDFSIGSDAHSPEDVGNFAPGLELINKYKIPAKRIINAG